MKATMMLIALTAAVSSANAQVTSAQLKEAAEKFINETTAQAGGNFEVLDEIKNTHLKLKMVSVHDSKGQKINEDTYFVCVDFVTEDGKKYDVDLFMQGTTSDNLKPVNMKIHKAGDSARYIWIQDGGFYKTEMTEDATDLRKERETSNE